MTSVLAKPVRVSTKDGPEKSWSVWVDNQQLRGWTIEFTGSRDDCLRYLDLGTNHNALRLWDFALMRPSDVRVRPTSFT